MLRHACALRRLSERLDQDFRNLEFRDQFSALGDEIDQLRGGRDSLAGESKKLKTELSSLREQSDTKKKQLEILKKQREFNKKYALVRRYFKKSEADVYKQGDNLVIRLKGVRFPSGKADLVSKNYPLINKVKRRSAPLMNPT